MRSLACTAALLLSAVMMASIDRPLDKAARRWVEKTMAALTVDEKIGQLLMPSFESSFMPTDSDAFDRLQSLVTKTHVGGFLVFGASEPVPPVLLNSSYGGTILGQARPRWRSRLRRFRLLGRTTGWWRLRLGPRRAVCRRRVVLSVPGTPRHGPVFLPEAGWLYKIVVSRTGRCSARSAAVTQALTRP